MKLPFFVRSMIFLMVLATFSTSCSDHESQVRPESEPFFKERDASSISFDLNPSEIIVRNATSISSLATSRFELRTGDATYVQVDILLAGDTAVITTTQLTTTNCTAGPAYGSLILTDGFQVDTTGTGYHITPDMAVTDRKWYLPLKTGIGLQALHAATMGLEVTCVCPDDVVAGGGTATTISGETPDCAINYPEGGGKITCTNNSCSSSCGCEVEVTVTPSDGSGAGMLGNSGLAFKAEHVRLNGILY